MGIKTILRDWKKSSVLSLLREKFSELERTTSVGSKPTDENGEKSRTFLQHRSTTKSSTECSRMKPKEQGNLLCQKARQNEWFSRQQIARQNV